MVEYWGTAQIAEYLGVTRQRAFQIEREKGFPDPYVRIGRTWGWNPVEVRRWARDHRPGF